jgi:hypothetical protein
MVLPVIQTKLSAKNQLLIANEGAMVGLALAVVDHIKRS